MRLARLIRRYRPHILHAWMYHAQVFATLALGISGRWRDTRLIWGVRCSNMDLACYGRSLRWVVRSCGWLSSWPGAILFNSQVSIAAHREMGFRPRGGELIDNGIDTERFCPDPSLRSQVRAELGIAPSADLIAHVARVDPMKDHTTFLAALGKLDRAEALLIGRDTERLATPSNVHALGSRNDVERLLVAADLIVSSSAFGEGFSNALAEGMAAGLSGRRHRCGRFCPYRRRHRAHRAAARTRRPRRGHGRFARRIGDRPGPRARDRGTSQDRESISPSRVL